MLLNQPLRADHHWQDCPVACNTFVMDTISRISDHFNNFNVSSRHNTPPNRAAGRYLLSGKSMLAGTSWSSVPVCPFEKDIVMLSWGIRPYKIGSWFKWRHQRKWGEGRCNLVLHPSIPVYHFNVHIMTSPPSLCHGPSTIIIVKWFIDWCCQQCYCQEKLIPEKENRAL